MVAHADCVIGLFSVTKFLHYLGGVKDEIPCHFGFFDIQPFTVHVCSIRYLLGLTKLMDLTLTLT